MDKRITDQQVQAIVNYILSVPTGGRPAGDVLGLVQVLQRLPPADAPAPTAPPTAPPAA